MRPSLPAGPGGSGSTRSPSPAPPSRAPSCRTGGEASNQSALDCAGIAMRRRHTCRTRHNQGKDSRGTPFVTSRASARCHSAAAPRTLPRSRQLACGSDQRRSARNPRGRQVFGPPRPVRWRPAARVGTGSTPVPHDERRWVVLRTRSRARTKRDGQTDRQKRNQPDEAPLGTKQQRAPAGA